MIETLKDISLRLGESNIKYMVMGSMAVAVYGIPRFTRDIDITVALTPDDFGLVMNAVKNGFKAIPEDVENFVKETWVMPLEHRQTGVKVDIIFSISLLETEAIKATREIKVDEVSVRYIPPEHLIVQKIIAGRPVDKKDAAGILEIQGEKINTVEVERLIKTTGDETNIDEWMERWQELKKAI
ncbi:MAG: nucleotidyl transferase AbiEii/AbiGii toxin family protein [bacterium]